MVRQATIADVSRLAEIAVFTKRTAYRGIFQNDLVSFGEIQVLPMAQEYLQNPQSLEDILVFDDEFVKGMVTLLGHGETAELTEFYVDPFFQGRGIGKALLLGAEHQAITQGAAVLMLQVLEHNEKARRFYRQAGFVETGKRELVEGTDQYTVEYRKKL